MFETNQKSTGTGYTQTVALLTVAFIFSPAYVYAARPVGTISLVLAIACSALCVGLAWLGWKKSSRISIPSIVEQEAQSK